MKRLLLLVLLLVASPVWAHDSFAPIVKSERIKVVHISTKATLPASTQRGPFIDPFGRPGPRKQSALGSGFIYSADGYIITNNHVVEKADKIEVTLFDGKQTTAKVIGTD